MQILIKLYEKPEDAFLQQSLTITLRNMLPGQPVLKTCFH